MQILPPPARALPRFETRTDWFVRFSKCWNISSLVRCHMGTKKTILLLSGLFFLVIGFLAALFIVAISSATTSIEYMLYRYIVTGQYAYAPVNYWRLILPVISLIGIGIVLCTAYILENRKEKKDNE